MPSASPSDGSASPHLHFSFQSEIVLFQTIRLNSLWGFILASVLTATICLLERAFTFLLSERFHPPRSGSRISTAARKTALYSVVTTLRLLYMLISMSLHAGLIAVIVLSLSLGQFCIECIESSDSVPSSGRPAESLLYSKDSPYSPLASHYDSSPRHRDADDFELARTPSSRSDVGAPWKPSRHHKKDSKLIARQIMTGSSSSNTLRNHSRQNSYPSARANASPLRSGCAPYAHARHASGGLTPTGTARKALFHIGSADDEKSTDSD